MTYTDINAEQLDALIQRIESAQEKGIALSSEDCQLLLDALLSLVKLQEHLVENDVTLHKLRKLSGLVKSSEKLNKLIPEGNKKPENKKKSSSKKMHSQLCMLQEEFQHHSEIA